jgi:hypothetical protein
MAVNPLLADKQAEAATRVSAKLLDLHDGVLAGRRPADLAAADRLQVDAHQRVAVTLRANNVNKVTRLLAPLGFQPTASFPKLHFAEGLIPVRALRAVGQIGARAGRFGLQPSYAPMSLGGLVTSEADFVHEADRVRATQPGAFDGAGQRIGVLSDSYNIRGGAGADIASGDLPAAGVTVLQEGNPGDSDEGRAMLQLIHDVAPGASLAFATAQGGEGNFANNIRRLANPAEGNARVIVDDIVYLAEPMFQDGVVAQAVDEVVTTRGVNYFTSAGNQATRAYESTTFTTASDPTLGANFYDFNHGAGVDTRQRITIPAFGSLVLSFQWDDPFYTANGVDTDLDVYVIDPVTNNIIGGATSDNLAFQDAYELFGFNNTTSAPLAVDLAIHKYAGPNSGRIRYVNYGSSGVTFNEYATNSPTVVPHAAAANGQGVAAVPYFDQHVPEGFTSNGPSTILFSPAGAPIAAQVRQTPQIAAVDGTNNTFFGGDAEGDGRPNFFGTSAAAPHAAAVAALVRQANPSFTPAQVYTRLQQTADDLGPSGFDNVTGFGLINAFDAVYPAVTPATVVFSDGLEGGALSAAYETRSNNAGRIQVTGAHTPFAGTRHLVLDASTAIDDALNEVILHVNAAGAGTKTLSFRQREFFGESDHAMPASFPGSNNSDGVALSVDGTNWFRVVSLTGASSTTTYTLHTFDLSAIAAANGLTLAADTRIKFQQYGTFPASSGGGFAFDDISVAGAAPSATPGTPDLVAATDTGTSSTDNRTNRDNSSAGKTLQFSVTGTVSGALVQVFADGVAIGSATAGGTTTTVTTSGGQDLADGARSITARQTESGKPISAASAALSVTVDTAAPTANVVDVSPDPRTTAVASVDVVFSEAVAGLNGPDLTLRRDGGANLLTGSEGITASGDARTFTLGGLTALTGRRGGYALALTAAGSGITDVAGNPLAGDASDAWANDNALPTVAAVFVGGSSWGAAFNNFLTTGGAGEAAFGFRVTAADQLNELPWTNLNRLSVRFSEGVTVPSAGALVVRGVRVPVYGTNAFAYDAATFTATWTLAAPLTDERVLLDLDAAGVTDANGDPLDGEWADPLDPAVAGDSFPSGNGTAGGAFRFRVHVLPADANRNGAVQGTDVTLVRAAAGAAPGAAAYSVFKDVDGSGAVDARDAALVRERQGLTLPAGSHAAPRTETFVTTTAPTSPPTRTSAPTVKSSPSLLGSVVVPLSRKRLTEGLV